MKLLENFRKKSIPELYIWSIQLVFAITAALKFITASLGDSKISEPDALLWVFSVRQMLMLVGFFEIGVVVVLQKWGVQNRSFGLILWISSVFLVYHLFLRLAGVGNSYHCNCLGGFMTNLEEKASLVLLGWMLLGSGTFVVGRWLGPRTKLNNI